MLTEKEAEDYIYKSYLKAEKYLNFSDKDACKRHPEFTKYILRKLSQVPAITVTGSKGKGSVARMIAEILQTELNVGLMTSPHISDFCERFRFNGQKISKEDFISCVEQVKPFFDDIEKTLSASEYISPIGIQAAVALTYFNAKHSQFNVIEHGKGARYDDVTNIKHQFTVINTIFEEHTRELGKTLAEIAADKVCGITDDVETAFMAEQQAEVSDIIRRKAAEKKCLLLEYGKDFTARNIKFSESGMLFDVLTSERQYKGLLLPLLGEHQAKNCAMALAVCERILQHPDAETIRERLAKLNWAGRQEIISTNPFIMLDACINRVSAQAIKATLEKLNIDKVTAIIGIPDDKDFAGVAQIMSGVAKKIILTKSSNPHYIFTSKQADVLKNKGIEVVCTDCFSEAITLATKENTPIVISGTTSLISDVKKYYSADI